MAHFTKEQMAEIEARLATKAVKDTDLPEATVVKTSDYVPIVQNGVNKKVTVGYLYQEIVYEEFTVRIYVIQGSTFIINNSTADLIAWVFRNEENITERIPQTYFSWERESGDAVADATWNFHHEAYGNQIHITRQDVNRSCTFSCIVPTDYIKALFS